MRVLFVKQSSNNERITDFLLTLKKKGWETFTHDKLENIDWNYYNFIIFEYSNSTYINKFEIDVLNFTGKISFAVLTDDGVFEYEELKDTILDRLDCWIVLQANENSFSEREYEYKEKLVYIPRFTHPNLMSCVKEPLYEKKINKIVFIGRSTGGYAFNGKNYRVEGLKKIYNNSFLRNNFWGVLSDNNILDSEYQDEEYNSTFVYADREFWLSQEQWQQLLCNNTLNLAIMGHTKFGYRQPLCLATKNVMVGTFDFRLDPYSWLFSEHFKDISYQVKEDFSDFEDVLTESLLNKEKTREYAYRGYDLYKTYYELNPDWSYRDNVWKVVEEQFNRIGIEFY